MVCLLAGHNRPQDVIAVADAANALKGFCYLHLLGMELCCVVKILEVAASTGAKVWAGSFCRVGMLLEGGEFAGLSISCRASPLFAAALGWLVSPECGKLKSLKHARLLSFSSECLWALAPQLPRCGQSIPFLTLSTLAVSCSPGKASANIVKPDSCLQIPWNQAKVSQQNILRLQVVSVAQD